MGRLRWLVGLVILGGALLVAVQGAQAHPVAQEVSNDTCLACHGRPGINLTLDNGEVVPLVLDGSAFKVSVHGQQGFQCIQCHTTLGEYPHPTFHATDRRDFTTQLYRACQSCHQNEYEKTLDSVHERARAAGIPEAALCTDCHGAHDTRRLTDRTTGQLLPDARTWIPQTCARCHSAIYAKYLTSAHGSALIDQGNLDVPTCIDCHGVHNIADPTTAAFRLKSPEMCARCHTDPERMQKYGLSTQVLNTYVADFHGTTVTLFEKLSPDAETNKPVCYDCHGVHDILPVNDPQKGISVRENLLVRCQRCHPGASADFPDAWLSHYIPSPDRYPLVFSVDLFYKILIPGTLGGMGLLVILDLSSKVRMRRRKGRGKSEGEAQPEAKPGSPPARPDATRPPAPPEAPPEAPAEALLPPPGEPPADAGEIPPTAPPEALLPPPGEPPADAGEIPPTAPPEALAEAPAEAPPEALLLPPSKPAADAGEGTSEEGSRG